MEMRLLEKGTRHRHKLTTGDTMEKKKPYRIKFVSNGKDPREAIIELVKEELKKVLEKNNATVYNLDEIASYYVSGEACNEE
ncbi:hypothetical protein ACFSL6_17800 [Paenibacillus thailandensis]|uniref:hypothetical protein n=1 Tax=Paenibacillus thailandensis TaxID=393250 RepID=UPI0036341DF9